MSPLRQGGSAKAALAVSRRVNHGAMKHPATGNEQNNEVSWIMFDVFLCFVWFWYVFCMVFGNKLGKWWKVYWNWKLMDWLECSNSKFQLFAGRHGVVKTTPILLMVKCCFEAVVTNHSLGSIDPPSLFIASWPTLVACCGMSSQDAAVKSTLPCSKTHHKYKLCISIKPYDQMNSPHSMPKKLSPCVRNGWHWLVKLSSLCGLQNQPSRTKLDIDSGIPHDFPHTAIGSCTSAGQPLNHQYVPGEDWSCRRLLGSVLPE